MGEIRIPLSPGFHAQPGETPGHLHDIYTAVPPLGGNRRVHVGTLSKAAVEAWAIAENERIQALGRLAGARTAITAGASQMTRPVTPITTERGDAEGFVQIPASMSEQAHQHSVDLAQCSLFVDAKAPAKAMTDASAFLRQVSLFPASPPASVTGTEGDHRELRAVMRRLLAAKNAGGIEDAETQAQALGHAVDTCIGQIREFLAAPSHPGEADRVGLGELERLKHLAQSRYELLRECQAELRANDAWGMVETIEAALSRAGHPAPVSLAALGTGDGSGGASFRSDHSASPSPSVSALTGECSSRGEVDYDDLNRLFALMPEGPWHPLRTGGGHEIRQIDTDPTSKHHWPFRLCQSIAGQRAACDDAVFAFIAGVLNAWPAIAAANSDDAYIERVLAMPEDELRKRFLADGQSPEQAATISRQAFDLAVLKVALTQIHDQYIINSGDMTDAEALSAIKNIAARALGTEAEGQDAEGGLVHEGPAPQGATPSPLPHPQAPNTLSEVEEARALLGKEKRAYNGNPSEIIKYLRWRADLVGDEPETRLDLLSRADAIEAALATLRASQEQDSEVRS